MLTLKDAFAIAQADYSIETCEVIFSRLRQLAHNGKISEEIFHAVALSAVSRDGRYAGWRTAPKDASARSVR